MSTLSVDTIQGKTTAGTVAMPAGTIIQVVTAVDDDTQSITSTSLVDTGLTLDITPKFQNSKMQIFANMYEVFAQSASSSGRVSLRRVVGGTETELGDHDSATIGYTNANSYHNIAMQHLDEPNTTSTITYKVKASSSSGGVIHVNGDNTQSQLCVMEIQV